MGKRAFVLAGVQLGFAMTQTLRSIGHVYLRDVELEPMMGQRGVVRE